MGMTSPGKAPGFVSSIVVEMTFDPEIEVELLRAPAALRLLPVTEDLWTTRKLCELDVAILMPLVSLGAGLWGGLVSWAERVLVLVLWSVLVRDRLGARLGRFCSSEFVITRFFTRPRLETGSREMTLGFVNGKDAISMES